MLMSIHEKLEKVETIDKLVEQNERLFKQNEHLMEQTNKLISLLTSNQSQQYHHSLHQNKTNDAVHVLGVSSDEEVGEDVSLIVSPPAKNCTTNPTTTITPQQSITNPPTWIQTNSNRGTIRKEFERDDSCGVEAAKKKQRKTNGGTMPRKESAFSFMMDSSRASNSKNNFDGFGSWKPRELMKQVMRNGVDVTDVRNINSMNLKDWNHNSHKFKKIINLMSDMIDTKEDWALWTGKGGNQYPWIHDDGTRDSKMNAMTTRVEEKLLLWVNSEIGRNTKNNPKNIQSTMDSKFKVSTLLSRIEGNQCQKTKTYYKDGRRKIVNRNRS
jgi:hypothetical protein